MAVISKNKYDMRDFSQKVKTRESLTLAPGLKRRSHRMSGDPSAYSTAYIAKYVVRGGKRSLTFYRLSDLTLTAGSRLKRYP